MEELTELLRAMESIPELSPQHVSLVLVVYVCWSEAGHPEQLTLSPGLLMRRSRVLRRPSFYTYLRDLEGLAFWKYSPAKNQNAMALFDLTNSGIFKLARYKTIQARRNKRLIQKDTGKSPGLFPFDTGELSPKLKPRSSKSEKYAQSETANTVYEGVSSTPMHVREEEEQKKLNVFYSSRVVKGKRGAGEKTERRFAESEFSEVGGFLNCFKPLYPTADLMWYFHYFQTWHTNQEFTRSHNWYATICTILNRHLSNRTLKLEIYESSPQQSGRTGKAAESDSTGFGTW